MIAVDLSKQRTLDADPKAIQQINSTANLDREGNRRFHFFLEESKETVFGFSRNRKNFMSTALLNAIILNTKYILAFVNIKMTQYNSLNVKYQTRNFINLSLQ